MLGQTINQRYKIESELGQGGMGAVYRANDQTLKRDVALKLLSNTRLGTEGRSRMLREAQTAAGLNHLNIVTIFDVGEHEDHPYITMELVEGQTLAEAALTDFDDITAIAKQICAALAHAHAANIIHRDLKPENIMIQPDGVLKLMDFGLARSVASRMTEEGTILGTVFYMAPEQARGDDVDHLSDLYSFGVVLYELITGSLPFDGDHAVAIITQHINTPAPNVLAKREDTPRHLAALVDKLLKKDPADRPQSADEIIQLLDSPDTAPAEPEEELSALDRIARGRLVGRQAELAESRRLWQVASGGRGQVLMVSGEPGIGKTRLTKEIITHAEVSGGLVLQGAAYAEGGMPYAPFRQILRKGLRSGVGRALDIPHEVLKDLLTLAPDLRSSYPDLKDTLQPEAPDPQQLWEHFLIFINLLSQQAPVLLVVEDIHWADSGSLSLTRHLARQTRENRVMILAPYREVEIHENRAFHDMLLDFNRENLGTRLKLNRLDKSQTEELLSYMFSDDITPDFLDGIYNETEGHPFFIEEVCKALVDSGKLYYRDGSWQRPSIQELGIPQSVHVAIQTRLDQLPEDAHDLLRQAAIIGREFDFEMLQAAANMDELELIDILEQAEKAQILEEIEAGGDETRFQFVHALIPTTLIEDTRTLKRRVMHRRAAEAFEAKDPSNLQALAYHLTESGELEKAVEYHLRLADNAAAFYANQEAIHSYNQALDYLRETDEYERTAETLLKLSLSCQNDFNFEASQHASDEAFALLEKTLPSAEDIPPAPHPLRAASAAPGIMDPSRYRDGQTNVQLIEQFCGLVTIGRNNVILPDLAARWELSDEGRKYVFTLRPGLKWSDGHPLTAHDFVFTWRRALHPDNVHSLSHLLHVIKNAHAYQSDQLNDPAEIGVRALDDLTLEVELESPTGYFLLLMSNTVSFPVPQHVVEAHGDDWVELENKVYSGPFVMTEWTGARIIYQRNPHYHSVYGGNVETIELDIYNWDNDPDYAKQVYADYAQNQADYLYMGFMDLEVRSRAIRNHPAELRTQAGNMTSYVALNTHLPPLNDRLVRQAFAHAIDKNYLAVDVFQKTQLPASGGVIPPGIAGHTPGIGLSHDPLLARRLLEEAGFPNGEGLPPIKIASINQNPLRGMIEFIANSWVETLGVKAELVEMEWAALVALSNNNKQATEQGIHAIPMGWFADYPDPHNFVVEASWLLGSGWQDREFADLTAAAQTTLVQEERIRLYQKMDKLAIDSVALIPLGYYIFEFLFKPWVKSPPRFFQFKDWIIEDH